MKFIIERPRWVCGVNLGGIDEERCEKLGISQLLNKKSRMCCLGQMCIQSGLSESDISDLTEPNELTSELSKKVKWMVSHNYGIRVNSSVACDMIEVNDNNGITESEREIKLKELALSAGHELEFIGELGI